MYFLILGLLINISSSYASHLCDGKYDDLNIIHLDTKSEKDFFYCFGYHHGKDRAWQMDFFKRVAEGRNAEVYGFSHLKSDLMMKLLDLKGHGKKIWEETPEDKKRNF
jgi:penicillin amidase